MAVPFRKNKGFSLIELLVALVIVSILVMVGVVTMGSKRNVAVREMTQQLASSLAEAQQLARSTGRQVTLSVTGNTSATLAIDFNFLVGTVPTRGGGFAMTSQGSNSAYAVPGINKTQVTATGVSFDKLKDLGLVADWDDFFKDANSIFKGSASTNLSFSNGGEINQDCFVTVSNPNPGASSPIGMVIATQRNGIHAYFFSGEPGATWRSL